LYHEEFPHREEEESMVYKTYENRFRQPVDWEAAIEFIRKWTAFLIRDDNGMISCKPLFPYDGERRVVYLCDFANHEDSQTPTWSSKMSDEAQKYVKEADKYFEGTWSETHYVLIE